MRAPPSLEQLIEANQLLVVALGACLSLLCFAFCQLFEAHLWLESVRVSSEALRARGVHYARQVDEDEARDEILLTGEGFEVLPLTKSHAESRKLHDFTVYGILEGEGEVILGHPEDRESARAHHARGACLGAYIWPAEDGGSHTRTRLSRPHVSPFRKDFVARSLELDYTRNLQLVTQSVGGQRKHQLPPPTSLPPYTPTLLPPESSTPSSHPPREMASPRSLSSQLSWAGYLHQPMHQPQGGVKRGVVGRVRPGDGSTDTRPRHQPSRTSAFLVRAFGDPSAVSDADPTWTPVRRAVLDDAEDAVDDTAQLEQVRWTSGWTSVERFMGWQPITPPPGGFDA